MDEPIAANGVACCGEALEVLRTMIGRHRRQLSHHSLQDSTCEVCRSEIAAVNLPDSATLFGSTAHAEESSVRNQSITAARCRHCQGIHADVYLRFRWDRCAKLAEDICKKGAEISVGPTTAEARSDKNELTSGHG